MLIGPGKQQDGLYYFYGVLHMATMKADRGTSLELWHKRLGHPSLQVTKLIPVVSCNDIKSTLNKICDVYQKGKQSRDKFSISEHKASKIFELIHCGLWGPYRTQALCGTSYFLAIVDDFSCAVWVYLLIDMTEVSHTMKMFFSMAERQFHKYVKIVTSDNGTKFTYIKQYFLDNRIIFQTSCTETPQQNGRVDQKHQHILNVARALFFQSQIPIRFYGDCLLTTTYIINSMSFSIVQHKTPYEVLYG